MRKLVVDGSTWLVRVGTSAMEARNGTAKLVIPLDRVTGRTWDVLERGRHKKTSDGMVTPSMMERAIRTAVKGEA